MYHIIRLALVIIPALLTVANAMAQVPIWVGPSPVRQGQTTELGVDPKPGDTYSWELYKDSTVNFAVDPGDVPITDAEFVNGIMTGPTVQITWYEPGVYFYKVTAVNAAGCTDNLRVGRIEILESLPTATITTKEICVGDPAVLTFELTGYAPWSFTFTDGTTTWTETNVTTDTLEVTIDPGPKATVDYWVTSITDKYGTNPEPSDPATQVVNPKPAGSRIYLSTE